MTADQRARLERRMSHLVAGGARVDRGQRSTAHDEELKRVVAVLTRGRRQPASVRAGTDRQAVRWGPGPARYSLHH